MRAERNKQKRSTVTIATLILSGVFAGVIAGPVFLFATEGTTLPGTEYHPPTPADEIPYEGTTLPPSSDTEQAVRDAQYDPNLFAPAPGSTPAGFEGTTPPTPDEAQKGAAEAAAKKAREDQAAEVAKAFSCIGGGGPLTLFFSLKGCVAQLMDMVMWIAARTLWIAGVLLNMTLHLTLNLNTVLQQLPIVDIGWKVLRDIANIVFIFVTLWAGISITLGIGDGGKKAWGLLAQMVLVALFINFSLFITKAVVDASNIAALHFYSLIVEPGKEKDYDSGLSEAFMYGLKLSTLYNAKQIGSGEINADASMIKTAGASSNIKLSMTNIILIGFFGSLFIVVAAWVFFAAAIMFIYRAITLIMLMLLSPLAFVGFILPGAAGMAHQWWSKLWSQAFFAPLYLALAYIVVRTINASTFQGVFGGGAPGTGFAAALTTTSFGPVSVIFNFVILIGLMVACLVVAQSLGAKGSEMAMAGWQKIKGAVVGGAIGVAGATVRGTIKAPSAALRGARNIASGQTVSGLGKWMATSKLLHNKYWSANWAKTGGEAVQKGGEAMRESKYGKIFSKIASGASKATDVRYMEERAGQSWLGQTTLGKGVRAVTTGALANLKIGDKSLQEAYEKGQEQETARHTISLIAEARRAGNELYTLREKENKKREDAFTAQENVEKVEVAAKKGPPLTPGQQRDVVEAEAAVARAKAETPEKQRRFEDAQGDVKDAEEDLAGAKEKLAQNPADATLQLDILKNEQKLSKAQKKLSDAQKATPEEQKRITEAEAALERAKNPPLTPEQDEAKRATIEALETAKESLKTAQTALEEFNEKNGKKIANLLEQRSRAYAGMSSHEFIKYAPREDKKHLDFESDPPGHYLAAMGDEQLTEKEKEEATHNYVHRMVEEARRGEKRNERFNEMMVEFQKKFNKNQKVMEALERELGFQGLGDQLKELKKQLAEAKAREAEKKKRS